MSSAEHVKINLSTLSFPAACFSGTGLDPFQLRDVVPYLEDGSIQKIVEFGSGSSTEFFLTLRAMYNLPFSLDSFDHSQEYCFKPSQDYHDFNLRLRPLMQYTDEEFDQILEGADIPPGQFLPQDQYNNFRAHNTFYKIEDGDLEEYYDLIILDGPNGNGRSIAFRHLRDRVRSGTKIVIDDYHHYPFLAQCHQLLNVRLIKEQQLPDFHPLHGYAILEVK